MTEFMEKRRWRRYEVDLRIKISFTRDGQPISLQGRGHDVSVGGLAVFLAHEIMLGTAVLVEFSMPYTRIPLVVPAVVRHRDGFRYGMEFMRITERQRQDLTRLCESLQLMQP